MVGFFSKKVGDQESLGERLIAARQQQELSLKKIAAQLNINEEYLQALEQGHYDQLPGNIYARNFLKSYLNFLKLNQSKMLELYEQEVDIHQKLNQTAEEAPRMVERITRRRLAITPRIIRRSIVVLIILVCLAYLSWGLKKIVTPPSLTIIQPANNFITKEYAITVSGSTEEEARLVINGQDVIADREGYFNKRIDLQVGINTITISAEKKYSKPNVIYRKVLVEETEE